MLKSLGVFLGFMLKVMKVSKITILLCGSVQYTIRSTKNILSRHLIGIMLFIY